MYSDEIARTVISMWLHGEHLEDVKLLPAGNFPAPLDKIAVDVRKGKQIGEIMKKHGTKFVAELLGEYYPAIYETHLHGMLQREMMKTLPVDATPEELAKHAKKYQRYWMRRPKPVELAEVYLNELHDRSLQDPIHTGIAMYDQRTGGIHKGRLTIIGARPSVGKSAFTLQVAFDVARRGSKVLFFPLEMSAGETVDRIVARFGTGLTSSALRSGKLDDVQMDSVTSVLDTLYKMRDCFKVYEGTRDLQVIKSIISEEHPDLVVIDQLSQIHNGKDYKTIREQYVDITRTLKAMALQDDVAIWLPCQMNREASKSSSYSIDYIKESGSIEEDADEVIILSKIKDDNGDYKTDETGQYIRIELAKNRMGPCGEEELLFNGPRFRFVSLVKGFEPDNTKVPF